MPAKAKQPDRTPATAEEFVEYIKMADGWMIVRNEYEGTLDLIVREGKTQTTFASPKLLMMPAVDYGRFIQAIQNVTTMPGVKENRLY